MIGLKKTNKINKNCLKLVESVKKSSSALRSKQPVVIKNLHRQGVKVLMKNGLPSSALEQWKKTDLAGALKNDYRLGKKQELELMELPNNVFMKTGINRVVLVNGFYEKQLSDIKDSQLIVKSLNQASTVKTKSNLGRLIDFDRPDQGLVALNTAYFVDGLYLEVPDNKKVAKPIVIFSITDERKSNVFCQPRSLILVGRQAECMIMESYMTFGNNNGWSNSVNEIVIKKQAKVDYYCLQDDAGQGFMTRSVKVMLASQSTFNNMSIALNGTIIRNDLQLELAEKQARAVLYGLYVLKNDQHLDNQTTISHLVGDCESYQLYKGVLNERACAVFNGRVVVSANADKTKAEQINKNVILSDQATVNTNPQLEVFADDVECRHSATIGELDQTAVFYLQARGLSKDEAQKLLLQGFMTEVVDKIKFKFLKNHIIQSVVKDF